MNSLQLQAKVAKLTAELKEEKEVCWCSGREREKEGQHK